ncbi:hypothetical protein BXT90_11860, partial [Corynebacterium amycolatum]
VFIEGHSITFELFGIPRHGGRLPFFPTQPGWISGVYQTGVRSRCPISHPPLLANNTHPTLPRPRPTNSPPPHHQQPPHRCRQNP